MRIIILAAKLSLRGYSHHPQVKDVKDKAGGMFGSSKLVIGVASGGLIMMGFKGGGRDIFGKALR